MFTKYKRSESTTKVLLLYLLLNKYEVNQIELLEEDEEDRMFGLKIKKIYGVINGCIDIQKIESEITAIQNPVICSLQSYEYYSSSDNIYMYTPGENGRLIINDMDVISKVMVVSDRCIVSSNVANKAGSIQNYGFMFFYEYVIKSEVTIGGWRIVYKDKTFSVYYNSSSGCGEELVYSAVEIDKTSTYKIVIYIIRKTADDIDEWESDSFYCDAYELVVK